MVDVISSLPIIGELLAESSLTPALLTASGTAPLLFRKIRGIIKGTLIAGSFTGLGLFFLPKIMNSPETTINPQYIEDAKQHASQYINQ